MEGGRLRRRRKELKLSGETVAKALGTTRVTVSRWEKGESEPSDKAKVELTKELNTTVAYLIGETDNPERNRVADTIHLQAEDTEPISYGYWGNVADNARNVAVSGDKEAITYVARMLECALSLLSVSTNTKDSVQRNMETSYITNMPVMVGKRNENTVTLATA